MGHVVIGTAGHIDHGKTTLIKALTGIETDRLKEEIQRGITIDLGFAWFDLPDGRKAGIVDVPGHEKFIKNMLAGISGIDIVLLIIAADEGVMPQTKEHLDILKLLKINKGIVVLTKVDLVEPEWVDLVTQDIHEFLDGTFLENAPVIPVSAVKGEGIETLKKTIEEMTTETESRNIKGPFRMPIDRVFTITGFGTVVTGTLAEGTIKEGQEAVIYPSGQSARVRKIQVHGEDYHEAYAGQRVAINVASLKKSEILRGDTLAAPESMHTTYMMDAQIELLPDEQRIIKNWTRLRLYLGTKEVLCRLVLLDREELLPGEQAMVQLRMEMPLSCRYKDRFVLRFYSPLETIGGGVVLDPNPQKHKRFNEDTVKNLESKLEGDIAQLIESEILKYSSNFPTSTVLKKNTGLDAETLAEEISGLIATGIVVKLEEYLLHKDYLDQLIEKTAKLLEKFHENYPLRVGMPKEEVRNKILKQATPRQFDFMLKWFEEQSIVNIKGNNILLASYSVVLPKELEALAMQVYSIFFNSVYAPPTMLEAFTQAGAKEIHEELLRYLLNNGDLIPISENIVYHKGRLEELKSFIINTAKTKGGITIGDLKNELEMSRKYSIPVLEYMDYQKITRRDGDKRVLISEK